MSVNQHDDYEKLAKLLYPSIEASGNVYYGQTRKLTMDEILQKNDLYFDSSIKAVPVYTDTVLTGYINYFCWKIGPLSGKIILPDSLDNITADAFTDSIKRILYADNTEIVYDEDLIYDFTNNTSKLPVFGTIFAKYRLDIISNAIDNRLNSGNYNSYEKEITPVFDGLYVTDNFNPTDATDLDIANRHFYIAKEDVDYYLYIQILTSEDTEEYLTFTAIDANAKIQLTKGVNILRDIEYSITDDFGEFSDWTTYNFGSELTIPNNHSIRFKDCTVTTAPTYGTNENDAVRFHINSGKFFVHGSCKSLLNLSNDNTLPSFALGWLFYGVNNLYGTPILPKDVTLSEYCYVSMFNNCISLHVAPRLTADELTNHCYHDMFNGCTCLFSPPRLDATLTAVGSCYRMFKGCTELRYSPYLLPTSLKNSCYESMFYNCNKLKLVRCFATERISTRAQDSIPTLGWLYNVSANGTFIRYGLNYSYPNNPNTIQNGIPANWKVITIEEDNNYYNSLLAILQGGLQIGYRLSKYYSDHIDYLVTSGSDSKDNGRGSVLDPNTLSNMEKSFDENGTHLMNTYNADGSFNQEVWGYKTFNSPVQFKNGIYGEDWSIYTINDSWTPSVYNRSVVISNDTPDSASIQIKKLSGSSSGVTNSVTLSTEKPGSDNAAATIEVKSEGLQIGGVYNSSIALSADNSDHTKKSAITVDPESITLNTKDVYLNNDTSNFISLQAAGGKRVSIGSSDNPLSGVFSEKFYGFLPYSYLPNAGVIGTREPLYSINLLYLKYSGYDQAGALYSHDYDLTFHVVTVNNGTCSLIIKADGTNNQLTSEITKLKYKINGIEHATVWDVNKTCYIQELHSGDNIWFYTSADIGANIYFNFTASYGAYMNVAGNPASLYKYNEDHESYGRLSRASAFYHLFKAENNNHGFIYDASKLVIDVEGANACVEMFLNNNSLLYPPLAMWCSSDACCMRMFKQSGILYTPINMSNNNSQHMYDSMFYGCYNLTRGAFRQSGNALQSVSSMFKSCDNLKEISILHTDASFANLSQTDISRAEYDNMTSSSVHIYSTFINSNIPNSYQRDLSTAELITHLKNKAPGSRVRISHYDDYLLEVYTVTLDEDYYSSKPGIHPRPCDIVGGTFILLSSTCTDDSLLHNSVVLAVKSE